MDFFWINRDQKSFEWFAIIIVVKLTFSFQHFLWAATEENLCRCSNQIKSNQIKLDILFPRFVNLLSQLEIEQAEIGGALSRFSTHSPLLSLLLLSLLSPRSEMP